MLNITKNKKLKNKTPIFSGKIIRIIFLSLLFQTGVLFAQTVDEVISKHIEATGGKEKLASFQTFKMTSSLDMQGMKLPIITTVVNNKSVRSEVVFQGMTQVSAMDGEGGWYISPFQGKTEPEKMNEEMLKEGKEQRDLSGPLFNYKEKGNKVELLGKEEMEGTDVFKLKITRPTGDITYDFIDASTYMLLKETSKKKFQDKEMESETLFSNYKMVSGINFAHTIEIREAGASSGQIITVESVEVNPKVDPAIFKMPDAKK